MESNLNVSISDIEAIIEDENLKEEYKTEVENPKLNFCCCKLKHAILFYAFFFFAWIIFEIVAYNIFLEKIGDFIDEKNRETEYKSKYYFDLYDFFLMFHSILKVSIYKNAIVGCFFIFFFIKKCN
jgi:hypothetical protein